MTQLLWAFFYFDLLLISRRFIFWESFEWCSFHLCPFSFEVIILKILSRSLIVYFFFPKRFFPDFYPSCYTEKRLNLKRLFKEIERKRDNTDVLGEEDSALFLFSNFNLAGVLQQRSKFSEWVQGVVKSISSALKGDDDSEAISR